MWKGNGIIQRRKIFTAQPMSVTDNWPEHNPDFHFYVAHKHIKMTDLISLSFPVKCGISQAMRWALYFVYFTWKWCAFVCWMYVSLLCGRCNTKPTNTLKKLEVFLSLSLLRGNIKRAFLLTFCRVSDSVHVSGKVLLCGKPFAQVNSLWYLGFHADSNPRVDSARGVETLRRLKYILPERTFRAIYFAIIYP